MSSHFYRAQVMTAPGVLEWREVARRPLEPTEARLRVLAAGVCGTDLALYSGSYPVPLPLVMGHEFCAIVEEIGSAATDADRALLGRKVAAEINNTCAAYRRAELCPFCRRGMPEHCSTRTVTGIIRHDGAFAEEVIVPLGALHALPEDWPDALGVFVEPLAAAIQTFERRPLMPGERVLVLGMGRLGILIAAVADKLGAEVLGVARSAAKLDRARSWRLETLQAPASEAELRETVLRWSGGVGADVVVEVTGGAGNFALATRLVRPRGTVCLKSTPGPSAEAPLTAMVVDEIGVSCSRCGPFAKAIAFQAKRRLPLESLIEKEFPLAELAAALAAARTAAKVLVRASA